jgi:amidohydrolase
MHQELIRLRRQLHQNPEVGLNLPATQEIVVHALEELPLEVRLGKSLSSVAAVIRGDQAVERTVLLRADMDALPVSEKTGLPYASQGPTMHACGHDLHMAMLVGAARLLTLHSDKLKGNVVLMFQPGEEGHDGARAMIDEGVIEASGRPADSAFALHVAASMLPNGVVAARAGTMLSAADVLRVTVLGAGGHGSAPHRARDPIPVAAEMVTALQTIVTRKFDIFEQPVVITVGSFHAGTAHNVIPGEAYLEASIRSFSSDVHARVRDEAVRLCRSISEAHHLDIKVECDTLFPVTVNDAGEIEFLQRLVGNLFGPERFMRLKHPMTASEDFAYILDSVPGAMAFIGACPPDCDPYQSPFNHSPFARFDEEVLPIGAALYAEFALKRLAALHERGLDALSGAGESAM